jgi:hypothetical protein
MRSTRRALACKTVTRTTTRFWDERSGKYLWFTKLYLGERLVARFESTDFLNWKNNGLVLRSGIDEGRTSQTYCMPVFRYGSIYLSYVMMYHVGKDRTVDCELAWSHDGLKWQRVMPGVPFIPRGAKGSLRQRVHLRHGRSADPA